MYDKKVKELNSSTNCEASSSEYINILNVLKLFLHRFMDNELKKIGKYTLIYFNNFNNH